jgi:nucleotide-binding universal stress UspA family protein
MMFQRILVAWDGSRPAVLALDIALDIARMGDAEIVVLSVAYSPAHAETSEDRVESVEAARRYLEEAYARYADRPQRLGVPSEHVVVEGERPADAIRDYAREHALDLIVVGHHRSRRGGRFLLRGVAERLVENAGVPLLVVGENGVEG